MGDSVFGLGDATEEVTVGGVTTTQNVAWNSKGYRQNAWLAGLSAPVGDNGTVNFSYQGNHAKNKRLANNGSVKSTGHIFSLGYTHDLSKRTSVYGVASYGWAKAKTFSAAALTGQDKLKSTQVTVGLRHAF